MLLLLSVVQCVVIHVCEMVCVWDCPSITPVQVEGTPGNKVLWRPKRSLYALLIAGTQWLYFVPNRTFAAKLYRMLVPPDGLCG
jgi:hypothetical protein